MSLEDLEASCLQCQRCDLAKERQHVVVSRGNPSARLMVIGEAFFFVLRRVEQLTHR